VKEAKLLDNDTQAAPALPRHPRLAQILEENWQAEMRGYYTYRTLAEREPVAERRQTLEQMATAEKEHAGLWAGRLRELGEQESVYRGKTSGDVDSLKNRVGGSDLALRRLEIDESRDIAKYSQQLKALGDEASLAILNQVIEDEQDHYRALSGLIRRQKPLGVRSRNTDPKAVLEQMLSKRDQGRAHTAGWIGDAIYGVNDGLGSIFGIVSGVSGATLGNSKWVLLSGLAGMIASALSMGSGAYLAAKSEREIYQAELAREREAIAMNGAEARELMSLYFQVKGLPEEDADHMVEHIAKDPEQLLRALAAERLNSTEEALSNPLNSAVTGALSTAAGAFIPVVPFFFLSGYTAVIVSAVVSLLAHFAVGAAKSLVTVRSWWSSGFEMTLVGAVEGVVTYVIGLGLGRLGT
jgi:VIT1/CCC1 family predicted Fe2+/Mn2+ transporter/rubrerythrin